MDDTKRKNVDDSSDDDDMFSPMKIAKTKGSTAEDKTTAADDDKADTTVQVPEGKLLARPLGTKSTVTGTILGSSVKVKNDAPTSLKVSVAIANVGKGSKDVILTDSLPSFMLAEMEKVTTTGGTHPYATLISTDVSPTIKITAGIVQCTLKNLKGSKGEKESIVQKCVQGATIQLTGMRYSKWGMPNAYVASDEFKVTTKAPVETPREGVTLAIDKVRASGNTLLVSAGFNCMSFRQTEPPAANVGADWAAVKDVLSTHKAAFATAVLSINPKYEKPSSDLLLVDTSSQNAQIAPMLCFYKTKVEHPASANTGVLWDDTMLATYAVKNKDVESLNKIFNGAPIVATNFYGMARDREAGRLGVLYEIKTEVKVVPKYTASAPSKFKNILTVGGPTIKAPVSFFAAPFGVNERTTADLLMEHVLPVANMIGMPNKCNIYDLKYEDSDYTQDCLLDAQCQLTIDVLSTFRNVALRLSAKMIAKLYDGASSSTPVVASGGALTDLLAEAEDAKPTISTLANGGVVSLCETAVTFDDPTLEFYGVVPDLMNIAQAEGNLKCGTDASVGEAAFNHALGNVKLTEAMKKGAAAVFAVRVVPKKTSVASGSGSTAA